MVDTSDTVRRIAKGTGILFVGIILSKILSYAYRILIARDNPAEYGTFSLALAIYGLALVLSSLGIHEGLSRYMGYYKGKNDPAAMRATLKASLFPVLVLSVISSILLFITADLVSSRIFHNANLSILLKVLSLVIPFDILSLLFVNALRVIEKPTYEVYIRNILQNVLKISLTSLLFFFNIKLLGMAYGFALSILITFFLLYYSLNKNFKVFGASTDDKNIQKEILTFSLPIFFGSFLIFIFTWIDTIMLGWMTTPEQVGIYNAAVPTSQLLYLFPSTLMAMFLPLLTMVYAQQDTNSFKTIYKTAVRWTLIINLALFFPLLIFSKEFLTLLFGQTYALAAIPLAILLVGRLLDFSLLSGTNVLMVIKKTKLVLFNSLVAASLNIILNLIFIPKWGIIGAALGTAIAVATLSLLVLFETWVLTQTFAFGRSTLKILASGLASALLVYYLKTRFASDSLLLLIMFGFIFGTVYLCLLFLTKSLEKEDLDIIAKLEEKFGLKLTKLKKLFR